jgi:hypothetical protein
MGFFSLKYLQVLVYRKGPEPQFVILAPTLAQGGNLISAPRLRLRNTGYNYGTLKTEVTLEA